MVRLNITLMIAIALSACGSDFGDEETRFISKDITLEGCIVYDYDNISSAPNCSLVDLAFLGQLTSAPSAGDVLEISIFQEPWMKQRFERLLTQMSQTERNLFRSVRGVVVSDDILPAFFLPGTGAIYLSPIFLSTSVEERATISVGTDPRAATAQLFSFNDFERFVDRNGNSAFSYISDGRSEADAILDTLSVLYHELAHANDFFPYENSLADQIRDGSTPSSLISARQAMLSDELNSNELRLESATLDSLAKVYFSANGTVTAAQRSLNAQDIADQFAPDGANDLYNYFSQYEDFAMLFEELAMRHFQNVRREVVFAQETGKDRLGDELIEWGQIGRVETPKVRARALYVATSILPNDAANFIDIANSFSGANQTPTGISLLDYISQSSPNTVSSKPLDLRRSGPRHTVSFMR